MSRTILSLSLLLIFTLCAAHIFPFNTFPPPQRHWPEPEEIDPTLNAATFLTAEHIRLIVISFTTFSPPIFGRHVGLVARAMYEASVPYTSWTSSSYVNEPPLHCIRIDKDSQTRRNHVIALVFATFRVLEYLYLPHFASDIHTTRLTLEKHFNVNLERTTTSEYMTSPIDLGNHIAHLIILASNADRSNANGLDPSSRANQDTTKVGRYIDNSNYIPYNSPQTLQEPVCENIIHDINKWTPVLVPQADGSTNRQIFLCPHCGSMKTFAVNPMEVLPPPPPLMGTDSEAWNIDETLEVMYFSGLLGDREKVIVELHADGFGFSRELPVSPAGQWMYFALVQAVRRKLSLHDSILLFFLQGMTEMDAGTSVRATKRYYDFIRPITRIQCSKWRDRTVRLWLGFYEGVGQTKANRFLPYQEKYFVVPPFGEYTSGHSQYAAAGAEALKRFFGSDEFDWGVTVPEGQSLFEPKITTGQPGYRAGFTDVANTGADTRGYSPGVKGVTLYWKTYTQYANEDGISRLYGGVHFRSGDLEGRRAGRRTAAAVWDKFVELTGYEAPKEVYVQGQQVISVFG